jgi:urease accessory protein
MTSLSSEKQPLSKLLQIASTLLPVGAYSYSQGLEWAIESGDVSDLESVKSWIFDLLQTYYANYELPILLELYKSWSANDVEKILYWDRHFKACKDSSESLAETIQTGYSLRRLICDLGEFPEEFLNQIVQINEPAFPTLYSGLCCIWNIGAEDMLHAYAWSWAENQVSVAMKSVPLGQVAGQKILLFIGTKLTSVVESAFALPIADISNSMPALSIFSSRHETQYSRLFRS